MPSSPSSDTRLGDALMVEDHQLQAVIAPSNDIRRDLGRTTGRSLTP